MERGARRPMATYTHASLIAMIMRHRTRKRKRLLRRARRGARYRRIANASRGAWRSHACLGTSGRKTARSAAARRVTPRPRSSEGCGGSSLRPRTGRAGPAFKLLLTMVAKARSAKAKAAPPAKGTRKAKRKAASSEDESDAYESDAPALDSDALDDEDDEAASPAKRKRASSSKAKAKKASPSKRGKAVDEDALDSDALDEDASPAKRARTKKATPRKRRKAADDDEEDEDELELAEGQMVVGRVVQAPTTGRVPPGQISRKFVLSLLGLGISS
jgi:hypothetical protein